MKNMKNYLIVIVGIPLIVCGIFLIHTIENPNNLMISLPYVCIGVGCGIFGHGMGNVVEKKTFKNDPELKKQLEILRNDERNVIIANRAKAKGYDLMIFAFGVLLIVFALMKVDLVPLLILIFTYLFVQGYALYYRMKYDKEM